MGAVKAFSVAELAQTLFEEAGDALFLFDPESEQVLDTNPMAQRLSGFSRHELLRMQILYLFRSEVQGGLQRLRHAFLKTGLFHSQEGFLLRHHREGAWIPVNITVTRLHAEADTLGLITARDLREQREVEALLRKKEGELNRVLASVSDGLWSAVIDRAGKWTLSYCSPVVEEITGRPAEYFAAGLAQWLSITHVDDRARMEQVERRIRRGESGGEQEYRILRPDGTLRWVRDHVRVTAQLDTRLRLDSVLSDITARREAEKELLASEQRFRHLFERNLAGVFRSTRDGRLVDCNDSFARIMGYGKREDILDQPIVQHYFDPRDRQALLTRLQAESHLANYELRMRRCDGSTVWLLENVSLLNDPGGETILEGTIVDITERKCSEEALRAGEAKYRSLIENLEQCIFLKDRDLRFVAANGHFCQAIGAAEADLIGKNDLDFYPRHLAEKYRADDLVVLREGRRLDLEEQNVQAGKTRTVRVVKTPVKDDRGDVVGVLGIFWDVTDQLALEGQLRHAQKMDAIGQLAGGVAHDFNNLLTVILGNLSFALSRMPKTDPVQELLRNAEQAGLRAAELTQRLLGFSRRTMLRAEPYDLNRAIEEAVRFLTRTLDPRIRLEARPTQDLWLVNADPGQINQVLMNLALNARDALPKGGRVIFETANFVPDEEYLHWHLEARPGEYVRLRVSDTGHGMSAEVRQRIFEPFFTTKETGKGTGLGLAMVFGIIKQHRGWIECESAPDQGTRFDIYLPRLAEEAAAAPPSAAPVIQTGRETILLIDDEPLVRNLGNRVLETCGYKVLLAEDGLQAVDVFRKQHAAIDLVILDGTMPRLSGRDTLLRLVEINPKVRVLFSSGYSAEQHKLSELAQVVGYLNKPYRMEDLSRKIREVLDRGALGGPH